MRILFTIFLTTIVYSSPTFAISLRSVAPNSPYSGVAQDIIGERCGRFYNINIKVYVKRSELYINCSNTIVDFFNSSISIQDVFKKVENVGFQNPQLELTKIFGMADQPEDLRNYLQSKYRLSAEEARSATVDIRKFGELGISPKETSVEIDTSESLTVI